MLSRLGKLHRDEVETVSRLVGKESGSEHRDLNDGQLVLNIKL